MNLTSGDLRDVNIRYSLKPTSASPAWYVIYQLVFLNAIPAGFNTASDLQQLDCETEYTKVRMDIHTMRRILKNVDFPWKQRN